MTKTAALKMLANIHIEGLITEPNQEFRRQHDDTDGSDRGWFVLSFTCDGDAWIKTTRTHDFGQNGMLRFRTWGGGSDSPLVRNALTLVALAMEASEEERPSRRKYNPCELLALPDFVYRLLDERPIAATQPLSDEAPLGRPACPSEVSTDQPLASTQKTTLEVTHE